MAILERLAETGDDWQAIFLVSRRPLDGSMLASQQSAFIPLPVQPLTRRPWAWPAWGLNWLASAKQIRCLYERHRSAVVVCTGGFVSGPAVIEANAMGMPIALVNLDAVMGRANRLLARRASVVFSSYPINAWPKARKIGVPLRRNVLGRGDRATACSRLGLEPDRPTLMICGGSQGAQTINDMMLHLVRQRAIDSRWQLVHLTGTADAQGVRQAYARAGMAAVVLAFSDAMGSLWASADLAICRAGANTVAEVWANAVPTIFLPYPFHHDQHQHLNARPLVELGAAKVVEDLIDPQETAKHMAPLLAKLMNDQGGRLKMADLMRQKTPSDGAADVADWVVQVAARS